MKIALLLAAFTCLSAQQDTPTATFTEPFVGFQFSYPKTWSIIKSNKKKDSARTTFSIPIEGSTNKAELDVDRTEYHAAIDLWQTIQLRANEQLHRQVVRQWTQEILGVSMLFTRIEYTDHGNQMTAVGGLYFTKTSQKLYVRLTSQSADFDKVFFEFSHVLETLKQLDGKLPVEDDPGADLPSAPKKPTRADTAYKNIAVDPNLKKTLVKAPVSVDLVVATRKMTMRMPLGWTSENAKDNKVDIKEPTLSKAIHIELFTTLDSDPAMAALTKLSAADLDSFTKVVTREDSNPAPNKAGCSVASTWRIGQAANGDLITCAAMGSTGDYYFLLTYRQTDKNVYKADRKLIELFLKQVSLEPAK